MKLQTKKILTAALLAGPFLASVPALAQDAGWYIGATVGQSTGKDACNGLPAGVSCDDTDTALGVFGGYQFNKYIGAELGYTDLGKFTASGLGLSSEAKAKGFEVLAVGTFPIGEKFSIYGKLGFFRWDLDTSGSGSVSQSESGTDVTYALGVQYNFTKKFGVRAQYQLYKDIGNDATTGQSDVDVLGVGVVFKF
jgi:OmpA-OmpF porin, OOP family